MTRIFVAVGLLLVGHGWAQQGAEAKAAPGVVVTGRVMFADTNGPARFSKVLLKNVSPDAANNPFADMMKDDDDDKKGAAKKTPEEMAEQKKQMAASMKVLSSLTDLLQATTVAADGTYTFGDVKPGTYYVHAMAKGYIDPLGQFSDDDLASKDPAMRKKIAAVATMVTVTGAEGGHADLRLMRGASVSGRVLYDDGTPAVGWTVRTVRDAGVDADNPFAAMGLDASDMDLAHAQEAATTDDTGYYRISGLPTGSYVVQARLSTAPVGRAGQLGSPGMLAMLGLRLTVFSGNTTRRSEAKPVVVREGENRADYDLTFPLHTMHGLSGVVRAKADGHPVNGGSVQLSGQTADGKDDPSVHLVTQVGPDGGFHFDYVAGPATYSLKVTGAVDQTVTGTEKVLGQTVDKKKTNRTYGVGSTTVQVGEGDLSGVVVEVAEGK